jgi:benzoyl-CoA reductase/2-hydroxyglutaryl-CoA dehydratase subunit BcrC/BadD/HgdB
MTPEALLNDEFTGFPLKRLLDYLLKKRQAGSHIVGYYCCYAPLELIWAMGAVPTGLCATSNKTIDAAETVLPTSICPLIKSSYGFIMTDTCPLFGVSEAIIAETTCDGKKKMYELIEGKKPMYTLDLPQKPDETGAFDYWVKEVRRMRSFLEKTFGTMISDDALNSAIKEANTRRKLILAIFDFARSTPPLVELREINEFLPLVTNGCGEEIQSFLEQIVEKLSRRKEQDDCSANGKAPRVMLMGCPIAGDAEKIMRVLEQQGASIVVQESCSGIKPFLLEIEEDTPDPLVAIARSYFELPCSVMTPNNRRITQIDRLIRDFKPDVVIDVILAGCHTYNVESWSIKEHIATKHGLPFLKVETDYSPEGTEQLRTRVEALMEMAAALEVK